MQKKPKTLDSLHHHLHPPHYQTNEKEMREPMEHKVLDILAEVSTDADTVFADLKGIQAAYVMQETERIMQLHREVLGTVLTNQKEKLLQIVYEFEENPKECLSIVVEHLEGKRDVIF